jgi:hypothetical protein
MLRCADDDGHACVDVGALSPAQLLALSSAQLLDRMRQLYPRLGHDRDHRPGRKAYDEALIIEIRALADRYRVLTADHQAVA